MTQLARLRSQLHLLRLARRLYRWGAAWSVVLALTLAALLALLAVDVAFEAPVVARMALVAIAGGMLLAAFWRWARPWLFVRESLLDMALLVERRMEQPGRSDLPAALQFESPAAVMWGSPQLEDAVIARVSRETRSIDVFAGAAAGPLVRRAAIFLTMAAAAAVVTLRWPEHVAVFFHRLALGGRHYPTATVIHAVNVNGRVVLEGGSRLAAPRPARCAEGQPLWILVSARGQLPEQGQVEVVSQAAGQRRKLPLRRFGEKAAAAEADPSLQETLASLDERGTNAAIYLAQLDRLMESLEYQVFLGDAWTDPARIGIVSLPVVETKMTVAPPDYARSSEQAGAAPAGARQLSVLEGSRIDLEAACVNEKPLSEVALAVTRRGATQRFALSPVDERRTHWRLEGETPLWQVTEELRYELEIRDEDGLRPATPLAGRVRIRPDRPPRVTARMVTRVVLPTAAPVVNLDLADDYGVRRPTLELKITRADGSQETRTLNDPTLHGYNEAGRLAAEAVEFPLTGENLPWRGGCRVNLAPLNLEKGDRVTAVFVVADYRGQNAARQAEAASQPLELEVSDEAGVYRAALEADKQALEDITEAADLQQHLLRPEE